MSSPFKALISVPIDGQVSSYWKAVEVFLFNPRVTSKNVAGIGESFPVLEFRIPPNLKDIDGLVQLNNASRVFDGLRTLEGCHQELTMTELREIFNVPETGNVFMWIVKILYKNVKYRSHSFKCYIIDFQNNSVTILPIRSSDNESRSLPYQITYSSTQLTISIDDQVPFSAEDRTTEWLKNAVAPRFLKWMQQDLTASTGEKSLKLVNCEEYNQFYNSLKAKYGPHMIQIWPERTDPAKFVYEDVAIASYLLLIWKQEREDRGVEDLQTFVDLGCGNGLLVYILAMEGHKGFGIDLRKRGIWEMYPKEVDLRVETIIPSDENLYPQTDWIIGNHSDELSPWVPVIAARSSTKCRFFLLPCCAFDFNGQKYQRRNSHLSQYLDFMEYAKEISTVCGYETVVDRLKIPSTKRICLIGHDRTGRVKDFGECSRKITNFINKSRNSSINFIPRDTVEAVRNCTKVDKTVLNDIVDLVFKEILSDEWKDPDVFEGTWNEGKGIKISNLRLAKDKLIELKSECGGLQTLLKNHHHIFEVRGGSVKLRVPMSVEEKRIQLGKQQKKKGNGDVGKEFLFQQKPCYFYSNHPNGCPLSKEMCTFKH